MPEGETVSSKRPTSDRRASADRRASGQGRATPDGAAPKTRAAIGGRRSTDDRLADHRQIERLAEDLLPALVAKLGASGLAEIEVREGPWKVRLRRPPGANGSGEARRITDRPSRAQPGHSEHGHPPGALEGHRGTAVRDGLGSLTPVGPGRLPVDAGRGDGHSHRAVATSPAVGIFQARPEMRPGTRIRAGDRLGFVDVLGVRQEVVSPVDGLVGATLVEPGDAVEYGQELVRIELPATPSTAAASALPEAGS
jgi:biotin carboxyl carrier protein